VEIHPAVTNASSTLPPSRVAAYTPEMALDGRWNTVWVEGAEGSGAGEWIELRLAAPAEIRKIGVVNGYGKAERFAENGRVRDAQIRFSNGTTQEIRLADSNEMQYFDLRPNNTASVRLTILSIYPGTRWDDTAIGEIRLWTRN
jgi:hypothetical protein